MGVTDDPKHPKLGQGSDTEPRPQNEVYLVLSDAERAKGFKRPVRASYRHVGAPGPSHELRDLTEKEKADHGAHGYVKFEAYPAKASPLVGRYWTQADLDGADKGCGTVTSMGSALAETYAREPGFYGSTYCCGCMKHRPVGEYGEFVWEPDGSRVGT